MPNVIAQINIALHDDNTIGVNGTLDNKMQTLGMLEVAKEAILKMHDSRINSRMIDVAPPGFAAALKQSAKLIP